MTTERVEPAYISDERTMLDAWLEYHRATLALKCEGLSAMPIYFANGSTAWWVTRA